MRHSDAFRQKDFFYALAVDEMRIGPANQPSKGATIPAVWFKRSKGETAICEGHITIHRREPITTFSDLLEGGHFSSAYGGTPKFKWDGVRMWSSTDVFSELVEARDRLDPLLKAFIEDKTIPDGYEGWFSIN